MAFNTNIKDNGLIPPLLQMFVLNRSGTNLKDAAKAFQSHVDKIKALASDVQGKYPKIFFDNKCEMVYNVKDGNTLASIINHEGQALSKLQQKKYVIYGQETQANNTQIKPLLEDLNKLLALL